MADEVVLAVDRLIFPADGTARAEIAWDGAAHALRVRALSADVEVRVEAAPGGRVRVVAPPAGGTARVEGDRVEVHGADLLRLDGGGVGYTYRLARVDGWLPWCGAVAPPAPPEHPDTVGDGSACLGGGGYDPDAPYDWTVVPEDYRTGEDDA
ncbi:hypothetical protein [Roseospira goensis]|uniref:Uncharacterized protein n=1 Tax=Roseospira goensis TaxID=391922 RepID=A0A7W6S2L6_9PROT|nr:hypothetical protein [Roseospira goensis]MBB4287748.1 hypothetical protein [Roseospira goensis]